MTTEVCFWTVPELWSSLSLRTMMRASPPISSMAEVEEWQSVQELAVSGRDPPDHFILKAEDRQAAAAVPPPIPIPIIDLRRLSDPNWDDGEAAKLRSALQSWGLFQAIGHDIPASFLDEVHNVAKEFFQLPMEVKQKYSNLKFGMDFPQGYGNDHARPGKIRSWTDRLRLVVQPEDQKMLHLWPEEPSSFRDILHEFITKLKKVQEFVLKATAKLLELNEDYFINQFGDKAKVQTRFSYYPSCSRPDLVIGLDPHSDNSLITILLSDKDVEGLEVLKDEQWVKVPTIPHALLVNLGDEMEIMSNGIFKSPVHRVMTNSEKERVSVGVFYLLDPDKDLGPADRLVNEARPRLYKTIKTGNYLEVFYQYFSNGKRGIEWAKI